MGRGIIKKEIIKDKNSLEIGKSIIPEIPEIVFTDNNDDYIDIDEIKILYENNKLVYKKIKSLTKCITTIKEKINIRTTDNSLLKNLIIACKINYNIKEKKQIILSSSDSDDGDKIVNKKINKNSILLSSDSSDDERM